MPRCPAPCRIPIQTCRSPWRRASCAVPGTQVLGVGFRPLPDWTPIPVEDLPKYLESLALGVNTYLSQARFRGWRRTQLLSSVNALWLDIDHYKVGHRWSDAQALTALLRACDEGEPAVPAQSYVACLRSRSSSGLAGRGPRTRSAAAVAGTRSPPSSIDSTAWGWTGLRVT